MATFKGTCDTFCKAHKAHLGKIYKRTSKCKIMKTSPVVMGPGWLGGAVKSSECDKDSSYFDSDGNFLTDCKIGNEKDCLTCNCCLDEYCLNGGTAKSNGNDGTCECTGCAPGFGGVRCELEYCKLPEVDSVYGHNVVKSINSQGGGCGEGEVGRTGYLPRGKTCKYKCAEGFEPRYGTYGGGRGDVMCDANVPSGGAPAPPGSLWAAVGMSWGTPLTCVQYAKGLTTWEECPSSGCV